MATFYHKIKYENADILILNIWLRMMKVVMYLFLLSFTHLV